MVLAIWLMPKCLHWPFCPGVFIAVLAVLAAAVAFRERPGRWEKAIWTLVFLGLMCAEVWMMGIDRQTNEDQQKLANAAQLQGFTDVGNGIKEAIGENSRNFAVTMSGIRQSINTATGGDSFCWLTFSRDGSQALIIALQQGKYPLHSVTARMVDLNKFSSLVGSQMTWNNMGIADTNFQIGDLGLTSSRILSRFTFDSMSAQQDFNIFFNGPNGFWTELLRLRKVKGRWAQAVRVTRDKVQGLKLQNKMIFEQVESDYPRVSGQVDWGN